MQTLLSDLRYALRQLRKSPGFAVTAILTLALGIGANVVVFSVLNALVLRPLNVPQPKNLFNIVRTPHGWDSQSYPDYLDYRDRNSTFSGIAAYQFTEAGITQGTLVAKSYGYEVSGNYFDLLGIQPEHGRFFHAADEHGPNSAPYIVLSSDFWRNEFHADPKIVGETIEVNKHPFTVLGIAPRSFHGTEMFLWPEFWIPMVNEQQVEGYSYIDQKSRSNHPIWTLARLKPGVTVRQATDNLNIIAGQMTKEHPASDDALGARLVKPGLMGDGLGDPVRAFLAGIMLLALLVLLAACANLGSIFAARAADRSRELAIRLAVGSGRWHILRQLLTESVVVSLLGGAAGTLFATALLQGLSRWQPFAQFPIHVLVTPDFLVYAVGLLLSLGSGVLFGLLPARQIWRTDAALVMKSGASTVASFRGFNLRDVLLAVQIAICTLLVTASLVAVRGMQRSLSAPLGIQPQGAMLANADLAMGGHSDDQSLPLQKSMQEQAANIPGVTAVGIVNRAPLNAGAGGGDQMVYRTGTTDFRYSNGIMDPKVYVISPGYLRAAGTQLLTGRDFTWDDNAQSPMVAIVNETFARKMFGNSSAIGKTFLTWGGKVHQIVGVAQDGKYDSLTEDRTPAMYFPLAQSTSSNTTLVVRSHLAPAEAAAAIHHMLVGMQPDVPFTIQSWSTALGVVFFPAQAAAAALGIMGLLAAMLAVTGIFGMAAYSVSKRMKELGIRVALGAQPVQLMRAAFHKPLTLLLTGAIAGLLLGILASRLLAQIVYQATPSDPFVMGEVVVTMVMIGLLATWIPARRALRVDPAKMLREE